MSFATSKIKLKILLLVAVPGRVIVLVKSELRLSGLRMSAIDLFILISKSSKTSNLLE
jgi:hypothetical protein